MLVAPDKFKGSCTAREAAAAVVAGLRGVWGDAADYAQLPLADGGDGTVAAFLENGAAAVTVTVPDALGRDVRATYARSGETAIVEMASASGLALLGARRDALHASTFGTGRLIAHALDAGASRIVLAIGGSATTDGGAGALAALGVRFLDVAGDELEASPAGLATLATIDAARLDARLARTVLQIACDVDNPLLGPNGAAATYGPQKGATPAEAIALEAVLERLADAALRATGRDLRARAGAGAAGGLGWGLATFAGARLERGFTLVAELVGLEQALAGTVLCVTGEGRIDMQSLAGKVVSGVAEMARSAGVPLVAIGGSVAADADAALRERGVTCVALIREDGDERLRAAAMRDAPAFIRAAAARFARTRRPV